MHTIDGGIPRQMSGIELGEERREESANLSILHLCVLNPSYEWTRCTPSMCAQPLSLSLSLSLRVDYPEGQSCEYKPMQHGRVGGWCVGERGRSHERERGEQVEALQVTLESLVSHYLGHCDSYTEQAQPGVK